MGFKKGHKGFRTKESYIQGGKKIAANPNSAKNRFKKGSSGFTGKHTEETKTKIREARKRQGSNVWNRGKTGYKVAPCSEDRKKKIGEAQMGELNHMWGKRGAETSNWKGGVTPIMMLIRNHPKSAQWRRAVFERDDYTCQKCKERGGILNADHIKRFSDIYHDNKIKSLDEALECCDFWDVKNGRTLCISCHRKLPTKFIGDGKR